MSQFELIRDANVTVTPIVTGTGKARAVEAEITINDKYQHRFPRSSRVSKHLDVMDATDLAERLSGGSFFMLDAGDGHQLVDFRDGQYNGFTHTDDSIAHFIEILGFKELPKAAGTRGGDSDGVSIALKKVWSKNEIMVPGFQSGGDFSSQLSFNWNPYVKTINSSFDLIRMICTNGMVGLTNFLNTKVPLLNRWEEHLDIASRQIQNKVNTIVIDRVQAMRSERASVSECLLLEQHAYDRLYAPGTKSSDERARLFSLMTAVAPQAHLGHVYKQGVFTNKSLAAQLPAHLTHFDVWNIATELRSHTNQAKKSSDNALDRFANQVLFDNDDYSVIGANQIGAVRTASFADAERAFYGNVF